MMEKDPQLSELLRRWPEVEPRPTFTQDVLRRIRLASPAPGTAGEETGLLLLSRRWWTPVLRPLAVTAVAAFVGGISFGLTATRPLPDTAAHHYWPASFQILQPGTLSGNYLASVEGGQP